MFIRVAAGQAQLIDASFTTAPHDHPKWLVIRQSKKLPGCIITAVRAYDHIGWRTRLI